MGSIEDYRRFMKSMFGKVGISDQSRGVGPPPLEVPYAAKAEVVPLPEVSRDVIVRPDLFECISRRRSRRQWTDEPLTLDQVLPYLPRSQPDASSAWPVSVPSRGQRIETRFS